MLHLNLTLLLVLVLGSGLGAAFPQDTLKKSCSLSKYQFLVPHELKAVQKMKEQFVSAAGNRGLWAGGGQGTADAKFETPSDKVDVFCNSLGMRKMFSKGVLRTKKDVGPNFVLVSNPSRLTGIAQHRQKSR